MTDRDEWTKGWDKFAGRGWFKEISGFGWLVCESRSGDSYELSFVSGRAFATRDTTEECQILAHETARLWTGETE